MSHRCLMLVVLGILLTGCSSNQKPAGSHDPHVTPAGVRIAPDVVYGHKFGMALTFDMYQPQKQNGAAVINIDSGGWRSGFPNFYKQTADGLRLATEKDRMQIMPPDIKAIMPKDLEVPAKSDIEPYLDKGFTIFHVHHGSSPKYEMPEIVADLRRAVRFIRFHARDYGIDAERLGLIGGSAGGHLSLLLGTTPDIGNRDVTDEFERGTGRVAAVVALFPPSDLRRFIEFHKKTSPDILKRVPALALTPEQCKEFSPISFVSSDDPSTLIIHGDQDKAVPILEGESMYQALLKAGVNTKFVTIPGAGHGFFGKDADRAREEAISWFEERLGAK